MPPNAELDELIRFWFGLLGFVLTLHCVWETISESQSIQAHRGEVDAWLQAERQIVAFGWVRAAFGRLLMSTLFAVGGWLLLGLPAGNNANTPAGLLIRWGSATAAVYLVIQALWARWDRRRIRRLRP